MEAEWQQPETRASDEHYMAELNDLCQQPYRTSGGPFQDLY